MSIKEEKNKIKQSLTIEQIFDLCADLGGEPQMYGSYFVSKTICHNPIGEGSPKLFYYENTQLFKCYTACGDTSFDIFDLVTKVKSQSGEMRPSYDEEGQVVGKATRGECHGGARLLHPVVHLHVFNNNGEIFLQKRPEWKDIQPGKWDTAVGGHIDYGETPEEALVREVREELGITTFTPQWLGMYVFESQRERELVYVYQTVHDGEIHPSEAELDGGRFWTIDEIRSAIGQGVLTPNFESEFLRFDEELNR